MSASTGGAAACRPRFPPPHVYPDITDLRGFIALYRNPVPPAEDLTRLYAEKGDFEGLVAEWRALVAERPGCPMRAWFLARALEAAGHPAEALAEYRRVRDLEHWSLRLPERKPWQTALKRAVVGFFTGLGVPGYSHAAGALAGEARIHEAAGEWEAAVAGYHACVESSPEAYDAYAALDRIHAAHGDLRALEELWSGMTAAHPERRHAWFCLGLARERGRRYTEAARAYEEALRRAPAGQEAPPREAMVRVLCAAAGTALAEGRTDDARGPLAEAESLSPDAPCALLGGARLAELTGDTEAALAGYRASVESSPEAFDAYAALDRIHTERGDLETLEELWTAMTAAHPERRHAWFCLGLARERRQRHAEAAQAHGEALRRAPAGQEAPSREAMVRALCAAAGTALAEGRTDDARGPLDEAESLSPDTPCALLGRARLAELTGDAEAALAGYRASVESSPEAFDAYAALDRIHAARGDLDALDELWTAMTAAHPERRHAWFCLGLAQERRQRYTEAVQAYEKALRLAPAGQEAPSREAMDRARRAGEAAGR